MPAGTIQYVFNSVAISIDPVAQVITVMGTASKYITDDLGNQNVISMFQAPVTYPLAGSGTRTLASIKADLLVALQAAYVALQGKTVS